MDQRNQGTELTDRQSAEDRRRADRRHSSVGARLPGQVERRRSNRRHIAGAGLLAALALGGVRYQQQRMEPMEDVSQDLGTPEELLLDGDDAVVDEDLDAREALEPIIQEAAALHGVDPDLVKAVIQTESRFDPRAASGLGGCTMISPPPAAPEPLAAEISCCDAIVCSAGASVSGTGTGVPTAGVAAEGAIAISGGGMLSCNGGGAAIS